MREVNQIPVQEISFHPTSFCDQDGRVFWWRGELYRGISPHYAPFCKALFEQGVVKSLVEAGFLVDTELTGFTLPGYPLVLKHRRLAFVSYASEWCPEMLKAAAQFTLDMMRSLAQHGLTVDVGTWDILFDGCNPCYVDFCSIAAADTYDRHSWNGVLDDFDSYFVNPLKLMSQGKGHLARCLLADYEHRIIHSELAELMGQRIYGRRRSLGKLAGLIDRLEDWVGRWVGRRDRCRLDLVAQMARSLEGVALCSKDLHPSFLPKGEKAKSEGIYQTLIDLNPATVFDAGCGTGQYSRLAASLGAQVVAIDRDDQQVAHCYQAAKAAQLPILPLVMDIRYPSPAQGQVITPAVKRLACELVMALGLLHLLVFEQHLTLAQAVDALSAFSTRWLLIEFSNCSEQTDFVAPERPLDYTLNALLALLRQRFQSVRIMPTAAGVGPLILCDFKCDFK